VRLADGGLETSLIFDQGLELPHFAAFPLVDSDKGRAALSSYSEPYLALARERRIGFVIGPASILPDSSTRRASTVRRTSSA